MSSAPCNRSSSPDLRTRFQRAAVRSRCSVRDLSQGHHEDGPGAAGDNHRRMKGPIMTERLIRESWAIIRSDNGQIANTYLGPIDVFGTKTEADDDLRLIADGTI